MNDYTVTIQTVALDREPRNITVTAETLMYALEETIWDIGDDYYILAVDFAPEPWEGEFALTDTRGITNDVYATKAEAIAHVDTGSEVLIAIPHLGR